MYFVCFCMYFFIYVLRHFFISLVRSFFISSVRSVVRFVYIYFVLTLGIRSFFS